MVEPDDRVPDPAATRLIAPEHVTGLVLAGGRGLRMDPVGGGTDKGWLEFRGRPLVRHVLQRLQPQVATLQISANRNLPRYRRLGIPVIVDHLHARTGPLAGMLAGLAQCETAWMAVAPCDAPDLPIDFVARLARAAQGAHATVAVARCAGHTHWTHLLLHRLHAVSIAHFLAQGHRRVGEWCALQAPAFADFDDPHAFDNLNTPEDLCARGAR